MDFSQGAAGVLAGITAAMGAAGVASVGFSSKLNQARSAFEVLLESGDKSKKMVSDLQTYAADTSFNFDGLSDTAKSMLAVGIQGQDVLPIIASVGDAIGTLGGGTEALQGVIRALSQIQAKGKLSAEEMNQLAERGVPGWRYLAESMGKSTAEVMKMASDGAIDATTAINAIVGGMAAQFKGGAEKANNEMTGQFESMKETVTNIMAQIGDSITESLSLKEVFKDINDSLSKFSAAVQGAGVKNAILGIVPPEATAAVFALGGALLAVAIPALYMFAGALWLAIAPMLPYIALGAAIGVLAYEIWKNWEPLGDLFSVLWSTVTSNTARAWGNIKKYFYSGVQTVLQMMVPLANLIGGGLLTAVSGWLDTLPGKIESATSEAAAANEKLADSLKDVKKAASGLKAGMVMKDISNFMPKINKPDTEFKGLSGKGAMPSDDGKAAKKAEQELKKLESKVKQITESIEREWVQTTKTELEQLEIWQKEQNDALNETMSANKDYERDKERVAATYAARRKKILEREAHDALDTFKSIRDGYVSVQKDIILGELTGKNKDAAQRAFNYADKIKGMQDFFEKTSQDYSTANDKQKQTILSTLDQLGIAYQKTDDDRLNFDKATAEASAAYEKQLKKEVVDYHATCRDIQADIDAAYNANSLAMLQEALNKENAIRQSNYDAQREMMDLYQQASADATLTWAEIVSRTSVAAYDGFKNGLADILSGTHSIRDAWNELGGVIRKVIANMVAEWIAGKIAMALFGDQSGDKTAAKSVTQGAATAAAWWPAAIAVSLATFGANAGPAMAGMAAATLVGMAMGNVSGKAAGGPIIGPGTGTSDSILTWLSNGEYVIKASAAKALGMDTLNTLNTGQLPAFATGGLVTGPSLSSMGSSRYTASASKDFETATTTQQQPPVVVQATIQAWDGPSVDRWLENGGGRKLEKYFTKRGREFAPVGG